MRKTVAGILIFLSCAALAQERKSDCDSTSVWSAGGIPVTAVCETREEGGTFDALGRFVGGGAHLSQESDSELGLSVRATGGKTLAGLRLDGSFAFAQDNLKGRRYADQFNPLSGNPFKLASEIPGNYSRQSFAFGASGAGWLPGGRLALGVGGDYMVGDLSRSNDPRSRSQILDLHLAPSVLYRPSERSTVSAALLYGYSKEKMLTLNSRAENLDKYKYYELLGVGEYVPVGVIGFSRRYGGSSWGGALQYNYSSIPFSAAVWGRFSTGTTSVKGEIAESPGCYTLTEADAGALFSLRSPGYLNQVRASFSADLGKSRRFIQEKRIVTNDQGRVEMFWETLLEMDFYEYTGLEAELDWTIRPADGLSWWAGAGLCWNWTRAGTLQPLSSFAHSALDAAISGGSTLHFRRGRRLQLSASAGARLPLGVWNEENPRLVSDRKTLILDGVLRPDALLLSQAAMTLSLSSEYSFPVSGKLFGFFVESDGFHTFSSCGSRLLLQAGIKLHY